MIRKLVLGVAALAASIVIGSTASYADFIGSFWVNVPAAAENATIAMAPGLGAPDGTFTTSGGINFFVPDSPTATVASFLASGGATCAGSGCNAPLNNSYFSYKQRPGFPATVPGGIVSITHDDGVQLQGTLDGLVINAPATSGTDFGPFSGPQSITLSYGECCTGPAFLQTNLQQVPIAAREPASLAMLGVALAGFGLIRRHRTV